MNEQQVKFFEAINVNLPDYQNLAQSIAEVLSVSTNEAYKKIRGTSNLSMPQLIKLSDAFRTPFSYQPNQSPSVTFNYLYVNRETPNMLAYLKDLWNCNSILEVFLLSDYFF